MLRIFFKWFIFTIYLLNILVFQKSFHSYFTHKRGGEGCINVYSTFIIRSLFHPYLGGFLNRFIVSSPNFYPTLDDNFTIELPLIISAFTLPMMLFMQPTILWPIQFLTLYLCDELHLCHNLNEQFTIKTTTHVKKFETQWKPKKLELSHKQKRKHVRVKSEAFHGLATLVFTLAKLRLHESLRNQIEV